ncbi:DoxX family protein [Haloechinothrix sp. LS1_15]|uniref:DoxX family protein n=1 Tax=Haloechinothrix sp. LS1_15 TaxID=2652248 RepID=UPI002948B56C|nr:DoxX family protein [Haloechinothrix sp. LS1_15]MDV6013926.1 DoxX family protein [Haloechinothrix sp. LS1_15]
MYGWARDLAALIGRIAIAAVFLAHGHGKWQAGLSATAESVAGNGIPLPTLSAAFLIFVEGVGSLLFVVGLLLPLVGIGYAVVAIGAIAFVHLGEGLVGGIELLVVLGAAGLALGFNGGRLSLDYVLIRRWRASRAAAHQEAVARG